MPSMRSTSQPVKNIITRGINLLFPSSCPICNCPSDNLHTSPICTTCWTSIKPFYGNACNICSRPIESEDVPICAECHRERPPYARAMAFGIFEDLLKEVIHIYKFSSVRRLAKPIGTLMYAMDMPDADLIVPVPLTKKRLKERGFNQSLLIAKHLSKKFGIRLSSNLLVKIRETEHQSLLKRKERLRSLRGAFKVTQKVHHVRVIIVDDVLTTGTTINECTKALLGGGAKEVFSVVVARARM